MAEKNYKITFSHVYKKLLGLDGQPIRKARLLLVLSVAQDSFRECIEFIDYDTDNGKYSIPYSAYHLILLFQKPGGDLFTTVRPQWGRLGNKKPYYDGLIGKELEVVITSKDVAP